MSGDAKRRFCDHCQLHVHNLSAMSGREREEFVTKSEGRTCIAYELRDDGSMVTPPRWPWLSGIQQAAAALLAASLPMFFSACTNRQVAGGISPPSSSRKLLGEAPNKPEPDPSAAKDRKEPRVGKMLLGTPPERPPEVKKD